MKTTQVDKFEYMADSRQINAFNEEFFSGADISLKFHGEVVSDISQFQYQLQEQMKPIYGYQSRLFDSMAIGNRIVIGSFAIPLSDVDFIHKAIAKANDKLAVQYPGGIAGPETPTNDVYSGADVASSSYDTTTEFADPTTYDYSKDDHTMKTEDTDSSGYSNDVYSNRSEVGRILASARLAMFKPYATGASGPDEFDAFGLVKYCYHLAYSIDDVKSANDLYKLVGTKFKKQSSPEPGDIVLMLFAVPGGNGNTVTKCGIYAGNHQYYTVNYGGTVVNKQVKLENSATEIIYIRYQKPTSSNPSSSRPSRLGGPTAEIMSMRSYSSKESPLTARDWQRRYNGRSDMTRVVSKEFRYIPHGDVNVVTGGFVFKDKPFMPTDKTSKVIIKQSYRKVSMTDIHRESNGDPNIHFLVKKNGTIEQGMPICFQLDPSNSLVIMVEGNYNTPLVNDGHSGDPENVPAPIEQVDAVINLLYDLKANMSGLRVIMGYRELMNIEHGTSINQCADPGVLFPLHRLVYEGPFVQAGASFDLVNDQIVEALELDSIYDVETYGEVSIMVSATVMTGERPADNWFLNHPGFSVMTSTYGKYRPNISTSKLHAGIDYAGAAGSKIPSPVNGTVIVSKLQANNKGFGNYVVVKDKHGNKHVFAHMRTRYAKVNDKVSVGSILGEMGSTGTSTGNHLHYGVIKSGATDYSYSNSIDPNSYLTPTYGFPEAGNSSTPAALSSMGDYRRNLYLTSPVLRGDDVRELQLALQSVGLYKDKIDGLFGKNTLSALERLENNGRYSINTLDMVNGKQTVTSSNWTSIRNGINYLTGNYEVSTQESNVEVQSQIELTDAIWGPTQGLKTYNQASKPFFYPEGIVRVNGFDIEIQYGYHDAHKNRKIKNVFLRSLGQGVDPSGQVVTEMYEFVARNVE